MTSPLNISSDDAAFFSLNANSPDSESDADGEEDSASGTNTGARGASAIGQLDMFVAIPPKHSHRRGGSRAVPTTHILYTPGAHHIP